MTRNFCALLIFIAASFARAESPATRDFRLDGPRFPAGTKVATAWASYTPPIRYSDDHIVQGTVGVGYYFWNNHAINVQAYGLSIDQEGGEAAAGGGVSVMGRYHFLNSDKWTVYFDGGVGYTWLDSPEPKGGTTYNFNPLVGFGTGYELSESLWLIGGARYYHMSNARQHGPEKNPGHDGVECYVGVLYTWK